MAKTQERLKIHLNFRPMLLGSTFKSTHTTTDNISLVPVTTKQVTGEEGVRVVTGYPVSPAWPHSPGADLAHVPVTRGHLLRCLSSGWHPLMGRDPRTSSQQTQEAEVPLEGAAA